MESKSLECFTNPPEVRTSAPVCTKADFHTAAPRKLVTSFERSATRFQGRVIKPMAGAISDTHDGVQLLDSPVA